MNTFNGSGCKKRSDRSKNLSFWRQLKSHTPELTVVNLGQPSGPKESKDFSQLTQLAFHQLSMKHSFFVIYSFLFLFSQLFFVLSQIRKNQKETENLKNHFIFFPFQMQLASDPSFFLQNEKHRNVKNSFYLLSFPNATCQMCRSMLLIFQ